jgi:hypothetical protein
VRYIRLIEDIGENPKIVESIDPGIDDGKIVEDHDDDKKKTKKKRRKKQQEAEESEDTSD